MNRSPLLKYQQSSVQTASPAQLLLMLYDGAIKFVKLGIDGIENRQFDKANTNLVKAQAIINELIASLDHNYEIADHLNRLYEYFLYLLIQSNIKKNKQPALEVLEHLQELKSTWEEASKQMGPQQRPSYV